MQTATCAAWSERIGLNPPSDTVLAAGDLDRQCLVSVDEGGEGAFGFALNLYSFEAGEDLFPENAELELGESASHAEVHTVAEREMAIGIWSGYVDAVGIVAEHVFVAVG